MHEFNLRPSVLQLRAVLAMHALAAVMLLLYADSSAIKWLALALLALLAWREADRIRHAPELKLALNLQAGTIRLEQAGQPYFFRKYKVYPTRWFAILSLVDQQHRRTLCLDPHRFHSPEGYRFCRFLLRQMEQSGAA